MWCRNCGGPCRKREMYQKPRWVCDQCGAVSYACYRVAVSAIVEISDQGILLVQRALSPGFGLWSLPGGYLEPGERIQAACAREIFEESGIPNIPVRLGDIYQDRDTGTIEVSFYAFTKQKPSNKRLPETLAAECFLPDSIPWDHLAFATTAEILQQFLRTREMR